MALTGSSWAARRAGKRPKMRPTETEVRAYRAQVYDIDMDKAKVRVMVSFFGRETPVELDFLQVEKA